MTLFVDDLTFSSEKPIPQSFKDYVVNRLNSEGLSIKIGRASCREGV